MITTRAALDAACVWGLEPHILKESKRDEDQVGEGDTTGLLLSGYILVTWNCYLSSSFNSFGFPSQKMWTGSALGLGHLGHWLRFY